MGRKRDVRYEPIASFRMRLRGSALNLPCRQSLSRHRYRCSPPASAH